MTRTIPIGTGATIEFVREVAALAGVDPEPVLAVSKRAQWYAKSVDSTYLTGKRVFVFGDATHAIAAARVASRELGFTVVGLGTYSREFAREVREAAKLYDVEALITDDYLDVEERVAALQPELVLGTQMERHMAKRLGIPCAVISAPVHVQDFPARFSPQMGFEGASVLFDTWVHPLMMGLEEHLLTMFRGDFEFHDGAAASHLGHGAAPARASHASVPAAPSHTAPAEQALQAEASQPLAETPVAARMSDLLASEHQTIAAPTNAAATLAGASSGEAIVVAAWADDARAELQKIPFFVRGKARRNTERFALERGVALITVETLYDAKSHFGR